MGDRITLKMIDGTLSSIAEMSNMSFERHGNQVFNTTFGYFSNYVYGSTKKDLYNRLQAILTHCFAITRLSEQ